jgi:YVTN family beta-propeller protein
MARLAGVVLVGAWLILVPGNASGWSAVGESAGVRSVSVSGNPFAVAVDPATDTAYVADRSGDAVTVIDLASARVTATISVGRYPQSVAVDAATDMVYVTNYDDGSVSVINGATNSVAATIANVGNRPNGVAVDASTDTVFVGVTSYSGSVSKVSMAVIDGQTNIVTKTISGTFGTPIGVAVNPVTDTVYAAYNGGLFDSVAVINAATDVIAKTISLDTSPEGIAADPATDRFYVSNYGLTVSAYSGATNALVGTVSVAGPPLGLAVNPNTGTVYAVTSISASDVALIDEATSQVTGTVPVDFVDDVAVDPATASLAITSPGLSLVYIVRLQHPVIESGGDARFTVGARETFMVHATGTPTPVLSETGTLPAGVTLTRLGMLSGTPKLGSGGIHRFAITASNGVSPAASQAFTLTVVQAPAFTSRSHAVFRAGIRNHFTVRTSGYPEASVTERGTLPRGVRFTARRDGTAMIEGIPAASERGKTFVIRFTARNGAGRPSVQRFTLTVR